MAGSERTVVEKTDLQKSIFNAPPSASAGLPPNPTLPPAPASLPPAPSSLKPPQADHTMEDANSPTTSVAGQKRRRDEESEAEEDSEGDVAMDEDSDDE